MSRNGQRQCPAIPHDPSVRSGRLKRLMFDPTPCASFGHEDRDRTESSCCCHSLTVIMRLHVQTTYVRPLLQCRQQARKPRPFSIAFQLPREETVLVGTGISSTCAVSSHRGSRDLGGRSGAVTFWIGTGPQWLSSKRISPATRFRACDRPQILCSCVARQQVGCQDSTWRRGNSDTAHLRGLRRSIGPVCAP